ncbi:hypothetical protein VKT23_012320 [Stygiomarasmius scandens]|uniref:Uncharacterized protein n=1 Tax=Marasmiellus scandens TaxID=2682957 RepID=A0ABR1J984_9AGAR
MLSAFSVSAVRDVPTLAPVSNERLALFHGDPQKFCPEYSQLCLDTSPTTVSAMKKSMWNCAVARRLSDEAVAFVDSSARLSARFSGDDAVDWEELFKCRLSDIFLDIQLSRGSTLPYPEAQAARYNGKVLHNKKRIALRQKFSTHQKVCAVMTQHLQSIGKEQDLRFWTDMLLALDLLTVDGMSDEETDDQDEQTVKVVKELRFRHSDFRPLLAYVDAVPRRMKKLFNQSGRKPFRRVVSDLVAERTPPPNLPSTFYQPRYLELMKKGLVPWVPIDEDTKVSLAMLMSEFLEVEDGRAFLQSDVAVSTDATPSSKTTPNLKVDSGFHFEDNSERTQTRNVHQFFRLLIEWVAFGVALYSLLYALKDHD